MKGKVCAKDLLPEKKPLDMKAYFVKTDMSLDPGEHWVAFFRRDQAIYFDSYEDHHKKTKIVSWFCWRSKAVVLLLLIRC